MISTSLNGTSLSCTTTDPITNNTRTYTISSVDAYINNEGIVATVSSSGTVRGLIYDINLQSWKESIFSSNSGNSVLNRDGIVVWVFSSGTVGGAVYDPDLQSWEESIFSSNAGNVMENKNGVVAWISSSGTIGGAVYDPDLQSWEESIFSSSSNNNNLSISNGTVYWNNSSGANHYGYNVTASTWQNNYSTDLYCKFFVAKENNTAPYLMHFSCLSMGTSSYTYAAGDGHNIYRRWGFKQYQNIGNYNASLTIQSSSSNRSCDRNLSVNMTKIIEQNEVNVRVFPNPVVQQQQFYIESNQQIEQVQIVDVLGTSRITISINQKFAEISLTTLNLSSGTYFMKIILENKQQVLKKISID